MKKLFSIYLLFLVGLIFASSANATVFMVNSQQEFDDAEDVATMNDSIIWESGTFTDVFMEVKKDHLFIGAEILGASVFNGRSRVKIFSDYVTLEGLQFVGGDIGSEDVINTAGSYNHFNQINIRAYTSYKYLVIRESCQYNKVTYCNFENRLNLDDKNILSILVDATNPGYHKVQHCSFKNFAGTGNDLGIEPIRIGLSTQADRNSRSLVEYCYFTQCNGDGEIISSKASQNVYRFNTFEDNPKAELVLRHGSEAIVYGNFFLHGKGGIRVREGQDHYIYNNYFYELDDRPIFLQNEDSDPLENIHIAFNTIVSCSELILGGDGSDEPSNVTFANNIFADPDNDLFEEPTGTETWIGNIANGDLGITLPASGLTVLNPQLAENEQGFFAIAEGSPAIDAALPGYAELPLFSGVEDIDSEILFDLMQQDRPATISEKDLGCNEHPHNTLIQPIATEENTGPSYNTSVINSLKNNLQLVDHLFKISPNPVVNELLISLSNENSTDLQIEIFDKRGRKVSSFFPTSIASGQESISIGLGHLPAGTYSIAGTSRVGRAGSVLRQVILFVKM